MPEAPKPSPPPDRGVSRNLFVEADPDLDALIESTADEPARAAGVRRRGRGLVVLAEQHRSPHARRAHDVERFARPNGNVGSAAGRGAALAPAGRRGCRTAAARPGGQAVPRAGGDRCAGGAAGRVQLAGARPPRHVQQPARRPTGGWLAPQPRSGTRRRGSRRSTAELRRLEQSAPPTQASTAPAGRPDVRRQPAARKPPPARRPYRRHR